MAYKKEDYTQFKDLVVDGVKTKPLDIEGGQLFYKSSEKDYYPRWVNGFFGEEKLGDNKKGLSVKSLSAVYFTSIDVDGKRKTFAVGIDINATKNNSVDEWLMYFI